MKKSLFLSLVFILAISTSLFAGTANLNSPNNSSADGSSGHHGVTAMAREGMNLGRGGTVVDSVPAPGGDKHMGLGWDGTYLWHVTNNVPINGYQFETISGTVINQIATSIGTYVLGCTYLNGSLWIQEWQSSGTCYEIDPNTGNTISSFASPAGTGSRGLTNDGTDLWIFGTGGSTSSGTAYQVTTSGTTIHTCTIGNVVLWPMGASYDNQRGTFFINDNSTANDIKELDLSGASAVLVDEFAHPGASSTPEGITYDGQFLWTTAFYGTWVWKIDIGDPPPAPPEAILYVDDDGGATTETYWETSFTNIGYAFDKWVVTDSSDVAPDSAAMSNYTIVVWSTGGDDFNALTSTDTTEIGKWLNAGGKLWLSSQDAILALGGTASWMHVSSYSGDVGCTQATGIDFIMSPLSFPCAEAAFTDYADIINPDATAWSSIINQNSDTNSVATDTMFGLPYFLYFNAFGWENISSTDAEADRDSMMARILKWMNYPPPKVDVGTQTINDPGTSILVESTINPKATFRNFGEKTATFDVHLTIDSSGTPVYDGNVQTITIDPAAGTTWTFTPTWTAGPSEGIVYDVTAYTVLTGDIDPSNDTLTQQTVTTTVSEWIQCANMPHVNKCQATCYDPGEDKIYTFGGYDTGSTCFNFTFKYDPVTDAWSTMTPVPTAIDWIDASVIQWNKKIYIFGGYDGSAAHNYNYIYDIAGDSWSNGANLPASLIAAGQVIYNDSLIYMLGGSTGSAPTTTVHIYNTYTDAWTTGTAMLAADQMEGVAILGDTIWLVGGYDGSSLYSTLYLGVIDPTNCENITWTAGKGLPDATCFNNGATQMYRLGSSYLYMVGGFLGTSVSSITNHAWEYNVGLDTWISLPDYPMTITRNDFLVARDGADTMEIYVCGGDNSGSWTGTDQVWKLKWQPPAVSEKPANKTSLAFGLTQNAPNPFMNGKAAISYTTTKKGSVSLKLYDVAGRLVRTLVNAGNESAGTKTVYWNGMNDNNNSVSAGVYFYRLTAEGRTATKKMVVVK